MASTKLTRTPSGGDNQKYTVSCWVKRTGLGASTTVYSTGDTTANNNGRMLFIDANDKIEISYYNSGYTYEVTTNRVLRDTNAWYHIVVAFDSTQATASDRIKIWVNGELETSFETSSYPSLNASFNFGSATHYIGDLGGRSIYSDFVLSHLHYIDGTAYTASAFGETDATTGIWKPKTAPSVTYGTNGVFLKFENSGSMGTDSSGNANNFTVNGTLTQTEDTPSNVFATLNGLIRNATGGTLTLSNGNTQGYSASTSVFGGFSSTLGVSSGKYYWEVKLVSTTAGAFYTLVGVTSENYVNFVSSASRSDGMAGSGIASRAETYEYLVYNGNKQHDGTATAYGDTMTTGDIAGIALDLDNNYIYFSKNGTWQNSGDPTSGATGTGAAFSLDTGLVYFPIVDQYHTNTTAINFGNGYFGTTAVSSAQNPDDGIGIFEYDVPAGYRALCTKSINAQEYS